MQNLGTLLLKAGKITKEQLEALQKKALQGNVSLEEAIKTSGIVNGNVVLEVQAESTGEKTIDIAGKKISSSVLEIIQEKIARNYGMVAFEHDPEKGVIKVAMQDPKDAKAREALRYIARERNAKLEYYLVSKEQLQELLKQYGNLREEVGAALASAKERFEDTAEGGAEGGPTKGKVKTVQEVIKHAPVAKMVHVILRHAVEGGASDIHIEPLEEQTRVRYRIDGALSTSITLPLYIHDALVARVKVMANLKIDETRVPQDGRIRLHVGEGDVELRVSTLPLRDHEKVVMRVLNTGGAAPSLVALGYRGHNLEVIERNFEKPNGMVLVTGPTGSGKSMTLFSGLSKLNKEDINISTLEDPVEYVLQGVNQSQVRPNVEFTFANGLRSLLRQDPDIIMVGEIRDLETAELAIHAAMTGHLVLSTLHTNSAIDSVPRMLDMKIEPYLLSTTLNVVMAQRLIRKICEDCKQEDDIDEGLKATVIEEVKKVPPEVFKGYGEINLEKPTFYKGGGCSLCGNTGFKGRTAITEVVENTRSLKNAINSGMKQEDVKKVLEEQQFISMKHDGLIKVLLGITTPEQIFAVTKEDI